MTGVQVVENFIGESKADRLFVRLEELFRGAYKPGRYVKRFGSVKSYGGNVVSRTIPSYLESIVDELVFADICKPPDHVTVNLYIPKGSTIPYHIDNKESGEVIIILSIGSEAKMLLRKYSNKKEVQEVILPKNSLLILSGEARWDYEHTVAPLENRRYSLVFRKSN